MSINEEEFEKLFMIEFRVNTSELKVGLTHNACDYAYVTSVIKYNNLVGVYELGYPDWYFPYIYIWPLYVFEDNCICKSPFMCHK